MATKATRTTRTGIPLTSVQNVHSDDSKRLSLDDYIAKEGDVMSFEDEIQDEMEGYSDAAELLTEAVNRFLADNGDFTTFEQDEIKEFLEVRVTPRQLSAHISNEFSRGILVGMFIEFKNILLDLEKEELDEEESF